MQIRSIHKQVPDYLDINYCQPYYFVKKTPLEITAVTAAHHAPAPAPGLVTIVRSQDTKSVLRPKKTFPYSFSLAIKSSGLLWTVAVDDNIER